ncbi:TPA: EpsG family protein, partial [Klebsiella pneumoniae subsp. pneumoniae]
MEMPFYVAFLIITIIALFFIVNKRVMHGKLSNEALIYPLLCCAIFTFFLNYNKGIFSDSLDYSQYFERLQNWTFMQAVNDSTVYAVAYMPGFRILSWLISQIFPNVHFYFGVIATIIFTLVSIGLVKILRAPYGIIAIISYTMYPYFASYTALGIRQGLALGVMFLVIASLLRREKYRSLWWIFISFMFHNTAAVLLLLYLAVFFNIKNIFKIKNALIAWLIT